MAIQCSAPETLTYKINPCCTLVQQINATDEAGESLAAIQFSFNNLDSHTCNLETSARDTWDPMWSTVNSASGLWNSMVTTVQQLSAGWQSAYTTVAANSAVWLDPITVIYPNPFPANLESVDIDALTEWANETLPASAQTINGCPIYNYVPGQKLWIFAPKYHEAIQYVSNACQAQPTFERALISVYITTINYGKGSYSSEAWVGLDGKVVTGSGHWKGTATLKQVEVTSGSCSLAGSYDDQYIGEIIGIEFFLNGDAEWEYNRVLY